ncbi:hypothetical protein AeMF1_015771 [Aphanomyces euteiches]|nr:hypothetical protein AeMF1_015771 [Aphanomyces euteiches]KAH9197084.1 hypothetical protein AeNC1_000939 [Aphanomyces euteiches]
MDRLKHIIRDDVPTVKLDDIRQSRSWEWVASCFTTPGKEPDLALAIVDTVFLQSGQIAAWYFTTKDGFIARKMSKNLTAQSICQQLARVALAYEKNHEKYVAVLCHATSSELLDASGLSKFLDKLPHDSVYLHAFVNPKGELNPTRYGNYEHDFSVNKNGKTQTKSIRLALGGQRIPCMDSQLHRAMDMMTNSLVACVEKHRKCKVVKCVVLYVVDDQGSLFVVRTESCETSPMQVVKPKKEKSTTSSNVANAVPSATTQRMLARAQLEEAPDEKAVEAIMAQSKPKPNPRGLSSLMPKLPPVDANPSLYSKGERRSQSAAYLGSSQKSGCCGDYCTTVIDPSAHVQPKEHYSLLGFPKGSNTLSSKAHKYERRLSSPIKHEDDNNNPLSRKHQPADKQDEKSMHRIPLKLIAQTRAEKDLVTLFVRRYLSGEDCDYLAQECFGDGDTLGETFPGYYYQECDVCANCFAFYTLIEEARSKALQKMARTSKRRKGKETETTNDTRTKFVNSPRDSNLLPWENAWNRARDILGMITKVDIAELRSFVHPPPAVAMVATVLMVLLLGEEKKDIFGYSDIQKQWNEAKRELSQGDKILTLLSQFNLQMLTTRQVNKASEFLSNELYKAEIIEPIWKGAAKFCDWTKAVVEAYLLKAPPESKFIEKIKAFTQPEVKKGKPIKALVQNQQMARLAGLKQEEDTNSSMTNTFQCKDGVTLIPYEVIGTPDLVAKKSNLVICHDFFDTLDSTKVFIRSVLTKNLGCQILLFNLPGQAGSKYPVHDDLNVLNNVFISERVFELLTELDKLLKFRTNVPFHIVGFGNGGNVAACLTIQYGKCWPQLKSVALINAFAKIDAQLAGILHGALNIFSCFPPNRPDLPVSYFSKFLFSEAYLARVDPNLALSIYTAVTNPISLEVSQLREIAVPLVLVQSVENVLIAPTNVDSFLEGRSCSHIWSHQHSKKGDLNSKAKQLLTQVLKTPEKSAFVTWLRAGHEVRQESKAYICDLLEFLVSWPSISDTPCANKESIDSSAKDDPAPEESEIALETQRAIESQSKQDTQLADVVGKPSKIQDRVKPAQSASQEHFKPTTSIATPSFPEPIVASAVKFEVEQVSNSASLSTQMDLARKKLEDQIAAAEALANEKRLLEKQEVENRLANLRAEQERRRKQWEDEDNARLAMLEQELRGRKEEREIVQTIVETTTWKNELELEKEFLLYRPDIALQTESMIDGGISTAPLDPDFEIPRTNLDTSSVLENILGPPKSVEITSLFEELEAEEERKRALGVLKVQEFEQVQRQMSLAQAEREKAARAQNDMLEAIRREEMAVKIQTNVRSFLAQREVSRRRKEVQFDLKRNRDGATIVRIARGALSRKRTREYKETKIRREMYEDATLTIQRNYKGFTTRRQYRSKRRQKYAKFIQRVYRGYVGRKRVAQLRAKLAYEQRMGIKATKVQATYRMHREKEKYLAIRVRTLAANEIQRVLRGHLARLRVRRMKEWENAEPGPEKLSLGLKRIEASKAEFEKQQQEIDALHRAQELAELKVSEIHSSLSESQKELAVLERELLEIDQIETDLHELTHEAELLRTRGVEHTTPLGNGIVTNQLNETGGFETKEEARKRQADAYAVEMAIHIKRAEREKKKRELEAEFTSVFNDVQAKKQQLEDMENKLSDMEATRMRKDREFTRLQRNLMELLEEQKYELDLIREKGIELETATATSAAAAAATAMKAKEHEKKSQAIFESTEELMKFQFMSMSLSYFSSLNMLKSLRDINADTTAAAITSTAETAASAAAAAAAANIPTMKRLQVGSAELMDAASKKNKMELEEKLRKEQEAQEAMKQPFPNAMRDWSIDDVQRWLDVLSLSQYKQAFKEGAVDGALLLELRPEDLSDILGVTHKAHILKILVSRKKYLPLSAQERMQVSVVESEEASDQKRKGIPDADTVFSQARNGRLKRLMESVEAGFDLKVEDDKGNTLLLVAAQNVNQKMVEFLVLKGANVNHKNAQGNTALHFAMAYDKEGILGEYLIGHGADDTIENMFGLSPYDGISGDS